MRLVPVVFFLIAAPILGIVILSWGAGPAQAADVQAPGFAAGGAGYDAGLKALFILFVLAILLESGLAGLFSWRPFVETFNPRAVKPAVSFGVALLLVYTYDLDAFTSLIDAARAATTAATAPGKVLTAFVLAGGSSGVNNIMIALGYRQKTTPETVAPKALPDKGWLAVTLKRVDAVGPVEVSIGPLWPTGATSDVTPDPSWPPITGTIPGSFGSGSFFLADRGRFPAYGGHAIPKDTDIKVVLSGMNASKQRIKTEWGPRIVAEGAIIELTMEL